MGVEGEEAPILRLEILQGPRQGETLDFRPGSAVRIGRVVRGNNLPIKDSGISTKHLTIVTESSLWILRDLDSSNGTVLDGSDVPPNTAFALKHDSIIKIGQLTSIRVAFLPLEKKQQQNAVHTRGNATRTGRPPGRGRGRGRGRCRGRGRGLSDEEYERSVVPEESGRVDLPARVTRQSNNDRSLVKDLNSDALVEEVERFKGRVQLQSLEGNGASVVHDHSERVEGAKSALNPSLVDISHCSFENPLVPAVEVKGPKNRRMTRNSKNARGNSAGYVDSERVAVERVEGVKSIRNPSSIDISDCSFVNPLVPTVEEREPKNRRVTRNSKNARGVSAENVDSERLAMEMVEGVKSTRNPSFLDISDCSFENPLVPAVEKPKNRRVTRNSKNGLGVSTGNVEKNTKRSVGGKSELQKEGGDGNSEKEVCDGNWPDLNKMNLGEWFDFLEVHLPKQIIDETEEMIDSMAQKAERLRKYILEMQQQNDKAEMPLKE